MLAPYPDPAREQDPPARRRRPRLSSRRSLFGVGLLRRVGIGKSWDGHASLIDAHNPRIGVEHNVEGLGWRYLRDEADIRDGRPVAMAERAARGMFRKQCLDGLEAAASQCWIQASRCSSLTFSTSVR
jgi:hypothetical protein